LVCLLVNVVALGFKRGDDLMQKVGHQQYCPRNTS